MGIDCCSVRAGLNQMFGSRWGAWTARREANDYRKNGVTERLVPMLNFMQERGVEGASVLDIGFGIGALHLELLKRKAASVIGIEVVDGYKNLASQLAGELGFSAMIDYRLGDFALLGGEIPQADIVVLDRSICCYPDWEGLVRPSARRARRLYGIVLPADRWYVRAVLRAANGIFGVLRIRYRAYMHPRDRIEAAINAAGLTRVFTRRMGIWDTIVYARA
jgi:SAM-dependent methyltransferase